MSLINQMLRDLEERRQGESRQQPGGEPAPVVLGVRSLRRNLLLLASGVLLAVLIWGGNELLRRIEKSDGVIAGPAAVALLAEKEEVPPVVVQTVVAQPEPKPAPVVIESPMPESVATDEVEKVPVASSAKPVTPVVEAVTEVAPTPLGEKSVAAVGEPTVVEDARFQKKVAPVSPEEQAQGFYLQALLSLQKGDDFAAESKLLRALELNPQLLDARLQLLAFLQQNNRTAEAFSQVEEGLQLHPQSSQLRKDRARQLLSARRLDDAIATLYVPPLPPMAEDLEYHALLAALLQEAGEYRRAAAVYRDLLSYRPQESMWWLGLAVSLDQDGDAGQAKEAYSKVVERGNLQADLAEYVESRLQAL